MSGPREPISCDSCNRDSDDCEMTVCSNCDGTFCDQCIDSYFVAPNYTNWFCKNCIEIDGESF